MPTDTSRNIEVFFDGACPLCRREVAMLKRWDRHGRIIATDIAAPDFDPHPTGRTWDELMARIHGRLPNGDIIEGVEVFRRLYSAIGLGWLVSVTRWPGIRSVMDLGYRIFARNRLRLTGRCDANSACRLSANQEAADATR
jgi:predicted DCC family thiol-disulfide oxidoreductase YuxK